MRPRINSRAADAAHQLALRLNLSDQAMINLAVSKGLDALGAKVPAEPVPISGEPGSVGTEHLNVYLPSQANAVIKQLARAENRSNRNMTREVIYHGLRALKVWPPSAQSAQTS